MDSGLKLCYNINRWQKVSGSHGGVAHLGERLNGIQEVESSILFVSTIAIHIQSEFSKRST